MTYLPGAKKRLVKGKRFVGILEETHKVGLIRKRECGPQDLLDKMVLGTRSIVAVPLKTGEILAATAYGK